MASNKKAQILAAVMCASSILGSYTMVSANPTATVTTDPEKGTITSTARNDKDQTSTITLNGNSLAINVGKNGNSYDGTFTLNSKNFSVTSAGLAVNNSNGVKVGGISNAGAITGTGLTINNADGKKLASLTNTGLNIYDGTNSTATASITKAGAITGTGLTIKNTTGNTVATLNNTGLTINNADGSKSLLTNSGLTVNGASTSTINAKNNNGKTTSTVAYNGVTDTVYQADGTTKIAESKVATNGITDTFIDSKNSVTYSVITNGSGTTFRSTAPGAGTTVINGGTITASEDVKIGKTSLKAIADTVNNFGSDSGVSLVNLAGIKRDSGVTTIEGATSFDKNGMLVSKDEGKDSEGNKLTTETTVKAGYIGIKNKSGATTFAVDYSGAMKAANGEFTVDAEGNTTTKTVNGVTIETYKDAVRSSNDLKDGDILIGTPDAQTDADKINLSAIDRNTAGITRDKYGTTTTIENTVKVHAPGVSHNVGTIDIYGDMIQATDPTGQRTVIEGNGITTNTITTDSIKMGDKAIDNAFLSTVENTNTNTAGISRDEETTTIEGNKLSKDGIESVGDVTSALDGKTYSLNTIGANTAGITRDKYGTTTIENTVKVHAPGVSHNVGTIDIYGDMIQATDPTGQRTVIEGNGITTNTVTTDTIKIGDKTIDDDFFGNIGDINTNIAGIERNGETTTIEGVASFNKDGVTVATGNSFVSVDTNNIRLNNSGNGIVIDKDGTSIIGGHGSQSINVTRTGTEFLNGQDGTSTVISGGAITTDSITVAGNTIDNEFFENMGANNANTAGIQRDGNDNVGYTTSIETTFRVHTPTSASGTIDVFGDMIQANSTNGQKTIITGNGITTNSLTVGGVSFGELVNRVEDLEEKTQNITPSNPGTGEGGSVVPPTTDGQTGIDGDVTVGGDLSVGGNLTADSATIGGVTMKDNTVTATTGNFDNIAVGGENGTTINKDGITVGKAEEGQSYTSITKDDVKVTDSQGNTTSLTDVGNRVTGLESSMNNMNNRLNDVEDRIDKVGAMAAAIANLRTMGFDPEAPTEIAIGVGQYKSETGLALGVFHYPNQDFMLSASISTSGDEVMGGIGATWKLGRKSAGEKALDAKDEEAKHLEKAEEMKKLAQDAKVKAQAERHAKLLAEREAQKTA